MKQPEMTVNGIDIALYGARLVSYTVSGTELTKNKGDTLSCALPPVFTTSPGTRTLSIDLDFRPVFVPPMYYNPGFKALLRKVTEQKSAFDAFIYQTRPLEIKMPDGFTYAAICDKLADENPDNTAEIDASYSFTAIRHTETETVTVYNGSDRLVSCKSNVPTDCVIEVLNNTDKQDNIANFGALGVAIVLPARKTAIIDGVNKKITIDGQNAFLKMTKFSEFVKLKPGDNVFNLTDYTGVSKGIIAKFHYDPTFI